MQKLTITTAILALVLALSWAGAGLAADPTTAFLDRPSFRQQATCPVRHGKIDKTLYVDYQGQRIYFCCKECLPIFQKDPAAYLKRMEQEGVRPERAPAGN